MWYEVKSWWLLVLKIWDCRNKHAPGLGRTCCEHVVNMVCWIFILRDKYRCFGSIDIHYILYCLTFTCDMFTILCIWKRMLYSLREGPKMKSERLLFLACDSPMKAITWFIFFKTPFSLARMSSILLFVSVRIGVFIANKMLSEKIDVKWRVEWKMRTWLKSCAFTSIFMLKWSSIIVLNSLNAKILIPSRSEVTTSSWSAGIYTPRHVLPGKGFRSRNDVTGRPRLSVKHRKGLVFA